MTRDQRWARGPLHPELLTGPISPEWTAEFRKTPEAPTNNSALWATGGLLFGGFAGLVMGAAMSHSNGSVAIGATIGFAVVGALIAGGIAWLTYSSQFNQALHLWAFARANGLTYVGKHTSKYNGMLFDVGSGRMHTSVLRTRSVRPVEFGNYQYTTGSGKSQQTHQWGYVAVRLENLLPHIVLDAEGNNGFFGSNLPIRFDRDQHLSLEGDFDRYFRLYCPSGYERDALYLFTPDVMVRFIDNAAELDVEIIDDWVYFYSKRHLVTLEPHVWAWMYSVIDSFLTKVDQWERWRDDRLRLQAQNPVTGTTAPAGFAGMVPQTPAVGAPSGAPAAQPTVGAAMGMTVAQAAQAAPAGVRPPNPYLGPKGVAPQGRRLRRGANWVSILIVVVAMIGWVLIQAVRF